MGPGVEQGIQSNTSSHERFGSLFQRMRGRADQPGINRRTHAMIDPLLMPCQCCGTPFVADPEAFIEVDMVRRPATAEEIRQFEEEGAQFLTPEKLEAMSEYELGESVSRSRTGPDSSLARKSPRARMPFAGPAGKIDRRREPCSAVASAAGR